MTLRVLWNGDPAQWDAWAPHLAAAAAEAGVDAAFATDGPADVILHAPKGRVQDFGAFPTLRAVLSLWAGVERIVGNPTLRVPLARMVDPGLVEGMVEYVTGHVLRHHLGIDAHLRRRGEVWRADLVPPLARERKVTVLGLGELGLASATALRDLRFRVTGWSRRPKDVPGLRCLAGPDGFGAALEGAQILVLLLPLTAETESLIDAAALARLAPGAVLLNPGRGALLDDAALLAALDAGRLAHATLDVFRTEPLPPGHPFWSHPAVTITPHIAAETRAASAARVIAENLRRIVSGEPLLHRVDRGLGY